MATELRPVADNRFQNFYSHAKEAFLGWASLDGMLGFSKKLKEQYRAALDDHPLCMSPSFHHALPSGSEYGRYLAIDLGGTRLRMALVDVKKDRDKSVEIVKALNIHMSQAVRSLRGPAFFQWFASQIAAALDEPRASLAISWSFPIQLTSLKSGLLQQMGKHFCASDGLEGQDLARIITNACKDQGLEVEIVTILNDSTATLLSLAYEQPLTRIGLILGTGFNMSCYLATGIIGKSKLAHRPSEWLDVAESVVVNVEASLFGGSILPLTSWDISLNKAHPMPEFQPFEHLVGGGHVAEICRYVLVEAIETVLGGMVPSSLHEKYSLDMELLSRIGTDDITDFMAKHPMACKEDVIALKEIVALVVRRSSLLVAIAIYTLWDLIYENNPIMHTRTIVAFTGTFIEKYPGWREQCQRDLDTLTEARDKKYKIELMAAEESSLRGAAVAAAVTHAIKQ